MEEYDYTHCCCFQCDALIDENSKPDCACDTGPVYYYNTCRYCPKNTFCDVYKNPGNYPPC